MRTRRSEMEQKKHIGPEPAVIRVLTSKNRDSVSYSDDKMKIKLTMQP